MAPAVKPWRFVVLEDYPDAGLLRGDLVTVTAGRPTRVTRHLPINPGLMLNLDLDGIVASVDEVIGAERAILAAMEAAPEKPSAPKTGLRVVR